MGWGYPQAHLGARDKKSGTGTFLCLGDGGWGWQGNVTLKRVAWFKFQLYYHLSTMQTEWDTSLLPASFLFLLIGNENRNYSREFMDSVQHQRLAHSSCSVNGVLGCTAERLVRSGSPKTCTLPYNHTSPSLPLTFGFPCPLKIGRLDSGVLKGVKTHFNVDSGEFTT